MSKGTRHIRGMAREKALEFLFGVDFTEYEWDRAREMFWEDVQVRPTVRAYFDTLIDGIQAHNETMNNLMLGAIEGWNPERIGSVERAAIRIGLFEMLHQDDVPPTVAINEAIELAKKYGAPEAPRFVNGVLDRVLRQSNDATLPHADS